MQEGLDLTSAYMSPAIKANDKGGKNMDIKDKDGKTIAKVAKNPREAFWDSFVRDTKSHIEFLEKQLVEQIPFTLELAKFNLLNAEKKLRELQR